ncbi:UbiA prenyltransferase family protein [Halostagnicola bangensis]
MRTDSIVDGLLEQVKPFFLVPAVAVAGFGGALAIEVSVRIVVVHGLTVGAAIYVAHLMDAYVDYYVRGEDSEVGLSSRSLAVAIVALSVGFFLLVGVLWRSAGVGPVVVTAPLWVLAIAHAPVFDRNPITGTTGYPVGIALAFIGGYVAQTGEVTPPILLVAASYVGILSGCKIMVDQLDYDTDSALSKRTVPVVLGRTRARVSADALVLAGVAAIIAGTAVGVLGPLAALASVFPALSLAVARYVPSVSPVIAVGLSMYPFSALLFGSLIGLFP